MDKFDGEVVKETDEDYVKNEINKAVRSLGQKDKNKVLYQLKQGNITVDNLQACLDKIGEMKHF
jgi:DNA-binding HxlR family transcriptional regulator